MNKEYLPFYNSLNQKEKNFWLECSKEELIDHFIANVKNSEKLLERINKAIEYIKQYGNLYCLKHTQFKKYKQYEELLEILGDNDE